MFNIFDFTKDRPLSKFLNDELNIFSIKCFEENNLNLEIATLVYEELKLRKSTSSKKLLADLLLNFASVNHEPIKWLKEARVIGKSIKNVEHDSKYTNSVYTILRDGYSNENKRYGVYVGQTSKTIEERFNEHKSGIRSGRGLEKNAIQILRSIWPYSNIKGSKRLYYETKLNLALTKVVPKVTGDINIDLL